jgi:hypothetical protein
MAAYTVSTHMSLCLGEELHRFQKVRSSNEFEMAVALYHQPWGRLEG